MGALGMPMMIAMALAPLATAAIWSTSGDERAMHAALVVLSALGSAGFWLAVSGLPGAR